MLLFELDISLLCRIEGGAITLHGSNTSQLLRLEVANRHSRPILHMGFIRSNMYKMGHIVFPVGYSQIWCRLMMSNFIS